MEKFLNSYWKFVVVGIVFLYAFTHLFGLTQLPVFADEAIYIRWSQLMIEDFPRYAFFPLNDGKTPMQMWIMIPFLKSFSDPLFAGRLMSVIVGFFQLFIIQKIIQSLNGKKLSQALGMIFVTLLPFWYFHHRMALIDGMLTFWLSLLFLGVIHMVKIAKNIQWQIGPTKISPFLTLQKKIQLVTWTGVAGMSLGLAFLTKLPTLFILPALSPFIFWDFKNEDHKLSTVFLRTTLLVMVAALGVSIFLLLKLHPAFGQLFSRGGDFTYSISEIVHGEWMTSLRTVGRLSGWLSQYLSLPLLLVGVIGLAISKQKHKHWMLWSSAIIFALPLVIFGKVLYPRYFMPMIIPLTVSIALFTEEVFRRSRKKVWWTIFILLLGSFIIPVKFVVASMLDSNMIPFVSIDREQYLTEWSAGNGIREVADLIDQKANDGRIFVMTEGYFGTLPDGLLMYFHDKNVENIEIEGIGAPVSQLPKYFDEKANKAFTIWLVVNSHRMKLNDPRFKKIYSFPRIDDAPSLDVYEFSR